MVVSESIGSLDGAARVRERRITQELVVAFLRDAILTGRLRGGARLIQDKIASDLDVSRVPVREALLQLEAEELVRMEAHRGASVVWLAPEEITEIFEIRELLVTGAVRIVVPSLTDTQVARLEAIDRKQTAEHNMVARAKLTHAFYTTLFEQLNRPRLKAMMDKLGATSSVISNLSSAPVPAMARWSKPADGVTLIPRPS
jgi:DNA-binding GntR family transcriptional regulator